MEYNKQQSSLPSIKLSKADLLALNNGTAYINDHFNCDLSVDQLCRITCMGRTKLKLAFKEIYGMSITEYIQQRRLSHAETLLAITDFTIEQVSAAVGYSNAGRFANMFKKVLVSIQQNIEKWYNVNKCFNYTFSKFISNTI